ncbi:hypothetical protein CH298_26440 [Rhodococcoides fascians]|uniref:hypothetical protein n=1 Tax=Rhodococcoides fascians TaxID=1828 RepID=UPI000B9A1D16|nr:hypothetical protein [Rhodococcus fascians]OZE80115.1 hypothetical protein CH303_28155 [Rhodococcus fascians]OZF10499.1 hypothetical protein CH298_26440 [Rhodococcus fascians]OZF12352.1 hypothetical protein CH297_27755 [Rhodococcus fascians]OZF60445.1 hypothetical protein CH308_26445 [Rhodococcus fascians]OZF61926.1 hypothetical protein CH307_26635 [Rhodococcus fascians]
MTALNWTVWGVFIASISAMVISGGVVVVDKTICSRHNRATTVLLVSTVVGTVSAGIGAVIA